MVTGEGDVAPARVRPGAPSPHRRRGCVRQRAGTSFATAPPVAPVAPGAAETAGKRPSGPDAAPYLVDWTPCGVVIPVLAGSSGAGASVTAAALADALRTIARRVLLVDAADPTRSGLAAAAAAEGFTVREVRPGMRLRYSSRDRRVLLARMESSEPVTPGAVPPPWVWPPQSGPADVSVVDLGHPCCCTAADPLAGAGGWLRRGQPRSLPILVVRPTRPSLLAAEQVLAGLRPWVEAGVLEPPRQLVVVGARRWPPGVPGAAGRLVRPLVDDALFLPYDRGLERGGVTGDVLPRLVVRAAARLLEHWQLLDRSPRGHL